MDNNQHLRIIILKLINSLTDDDRKRLHFVFSNDIPRRIRDDVSFGGTLDMIQYLYDQDKTNERDVTILINVFQGIKCMDAMKSLRDHMKRMYANELLESVETSIIPLPYSIESLTDKEKISIIIRILLKIALLTYDHINNEMIVLTKEKEDILILDVDERSSQTKSNEFFQQSWIQLARNLIFTALLLVIIALSIVTGLMLVENNQLKKALKPSPNTYYRLSTQLQGDDKSLDIVNGENKDKPVLAKNGDYSGQMWKITAMDFIV